MKLASAVLIAGLVCAASTTTAQPSATYYRQQVKCVLDHLDSYKNWANTVADPFVSIPLKTCPFTDLTSPDAIALLQKNELPNVSDFPNVSVRFILLIKKSELDCLGQYATLINGSGDTIQLPSPLCH